MFTIVFGYTYPVAANSLEPDSFDKSVLQADTILVARVIQHVPCKGALGDDPRIFNADHPSNIMVGSLNDFMYDERSLPQGTYQFHVVRVLKGSAPADLTLPLSYKFSLDYAYVLMRIVPGDIVLLVLRNTARGLVPQDVKVPVIWVAHDSPPVIDTSTPLDEQVDDLVVSGFKSPLFRKGNLCLLRHSHSAAVLQAARIYQSDKNPYARSFVLYIESENGDFSSIPKITALITEMRRPYGSSPAESALSRFRDPRSEPYLNVQAFYPIADVRVRIYDALAKVGNTTSVPYLLGANCTQSDEDNPYNAYFALNRIVPTLTPVADYGTFMAHRDRYFQPYWKWWIDTLKGLHPLAAPWLSKPQPIPPDAGYTVNDDLFNLSAPVRETAITKLHSSADWKSVPYLLVALRDPDERVAWGAYGLLRRVTKVKGAALTKARFLANPVAASRSLGEVWDKYSMSL